MYARITIMLIWIWTANKTPLHTTVEMRFYRFLKTVKPVQLLGRRNGSSANAGHHEAKVLEPYAVPHHSHYPSEPFAFGFNPSEPLEGWEIVTISTIIASIAIFAYGSSTGVNDDFKVSFESATLTNVSKQVNACVSLVGLGPQRGLSAWGGDKKWGYHWIWKILSKR